MIRTNVHLTEKQIAELAKRAKRDGLKTSEIIRRAIDEYFKRNK